MNGFVEWLTDILKGARPWFIVQPWELAVLTRLGLHPRLVAAGCHFRIPYLDEVITVNTRLRVASMPALTVSTKDRKTVTVSGQVAIRVFDPMALCLKLAEPETLVSVLAQRAAARYVSEAQSADLSAIQLANLIAVHVREHVQEAGIDVEYATVVDFAIVHTIRLLQETWRPSSEHTKL